MLNFPSDERVYAKTGSCVRNTLCCLISLSPKMFKSFQTAPLKPQQNALSAFYKDHKASVPATSSFLRTLFFLPSPLS